MDVYYSNIYLCDMFLLFSLHVYVYIEVWLRLPSGEQVSIVASKDSLSVRVHRQSSKGTLSKQVHLNGKYNSPPSLSVNVSLFFSPTPFLHFSIPSLSHSGGFKGGGGGSGPGPHLWVKKRVKIR